MKSKKITSATSWANADQSKAHTTDTTDTAPTDPAQHSVSEQIWQWFSKKNPHLQELRSRLTLTLLKHPDHFTIWKIIEDEKRPDSE